MNNATFDYYNTHFSDFIAGTVNAQFTQMQDLFLSYVKPHGLILDFGCGSGRDTKYFLEKGYAVDAIDGSVQLCASASAFTGIQVKQMLFLCAGHGTYLGGESPLWGRSLPAPTTSRTSRVSIVRWNLKEDVGKPLA